MTKDKVIIGFQVSKENKNEIEKVAANYKVDTLAIPLTVSQFCRIAVGRLLQEYKNKGGK
ncbi:MAG: hypothetical protein WC319_03590 [Candidatus Paceibacterota bacterium]|jgi:GTP-sensing pleiotropic transcriptional regulator CodY